MKELRVIFPFPSPDLHGVYDGKKGWNTFIHGHQLDVIANMEGWGMDNYERWSGRLCALDDMTGGLGYQFLVSNGVHRGEIKCPGQGDG